MPPRDPTAIESESGTTFYSARQGRIVGHTSTSPAVEVFFYAALQQTAKLSTSRTRIFESARPARRMGKSHDVPVSDSAFEPDSAVSEDSAGFVTKVPGTI